MKSSTIRRSTLSKESMDVIETLAKENKDEDLGEYVRPEDQQTNESEDLFASKAQEIDLLWQNFKTTQFSTNSTAAYILLGFVIGVIVSVLCFVILGLAVTKSGGTLHIGNKALFASAPVELSSLNDQADAAQEEVEAKVVVPSEENDNTTVAVSEEPQEPAQTEPVLDKSKMKKYVVKNGDTVESIIKKNYGSYSQEKAELIMKANNMKSLDRINIDQELLIPMQ